MFSGMNYVYEVYKEQSFSKAAENLYISQPALSSMIKKMQVMTASFRGAAVSATTLKLAIQGLLISTGVGVAIVADTAEPFGCSA